MEIYNLNGRLTADPVMRSTANGESVLNFSVACNRYSKENKNEAKFYNCSIFGQRANQLSKVLRKGMNIACVGEPRFYKSSKGDELENILLHSAEPIFLKSKSDEKEYTDDIPFPEGDGKDYSNWGNEKKDDFDNGKDFAQAMKEEFNGEDVSDIPF